MSMSLRPLRSGVLALSFFLGACVMAGGTRDGGGIADRDGGIRIASFDFAESSVVAALYAHVLEQHGYRVDPLLRSGTRELVEPALEQDEVDFVPEYLGTALTFVTLGRAQVSSDARRMHQQLRHVLADEGVDVLRFAPAQDQNGIAVTQQTAAHHDLRHVSDLRSVAPHLVFGGPPECDERPFCLPGLEGKYGLRFKRFEALDAGGPETVSALASGEIDVALLFTTDPSVDSEGFVLLQDDRRLQPAENIVPIVREEVVDRYGRRFVRTVNSVTDRLSTRTLLSLNKQVINGRSPTAVSREWIEREGLD
jgi:osmoprotectant transport system substrate-binding protein